MTESELFANLTEQEKRRINKTTEHLRYKYQMDGITAFKTSLKIFKTGKIMAIFGKVIGLSSESCNRLRVAFEKMKNAIKEK